MKITKYLVPVLHIYACTAVLMWACGAFGFGFAKLGLLATLGTALALTGAAWIAYAAIAIAVCLTFRLQNPGFVAATVFGIVAGSLAIPFIGWIIPGTLLGTGILAAISFSVVNTFAIWGAAYMSGYLRKDLTLWPVRQ